MHDALYRNALLRCAERYAAQALEMPDADLLDLVIQFREGVRAGLPLMKMNRWLGYIQGTLIAAGVTTVEAERDWTRPLFRPLDFEEE